VSFQPNVKRYAGHGHKSAGFFVMPNRYFTLNNVVGEFVQIQQGNRTIFGRVIQTGRIAQGGARKIYLRLIVDDPMDRSGYSIALAGESNPCVVTRRVALDRGRYETRIELFVPAAFINGK
jgi:hypothetical protein